MKKITPYIITIIFFCLLFVVTLTTDIIETFFGYNQNQFGQFFNYKLGIQRDFIVYGLVLVLCFLSFLEKLINEHSKFITRLFLSIITVLIIFINNGVLYSIIDIKAWCIYESPRVKNTEYVFFFVELAFVSLGLIIIEAITVTKVFKRNRPNLLKLVPGFIKKYYKPVKIPYI